MRAPTLRRLVSAVLPVMLLSALPSAGLKAQVPSVPACSIVAATPVAFGFYSVFRPDPTDSTGSLTFVCTGSAGTVTVSLSGVTSSGQRAMKNGAEELAYNIYTDAARTQPWGDGTGGAAPATFYQPADATPVTAVMYGRIFASQDILTGPYADSLVATINF